MGQKYPQGFVVTRYNDARSTIVDYFLKGKGDKKAVEAKIGDLLKRTYKTSFRNQDNQLSIEALSAFRKTKTLDLSNFSVSRSDNKGNKLNVNGVDVSIDPDIVFHGKFKGKPFVGAIKLHISKGNNLDSNSGKYVCTLLRHYLQINHGSSMILPEFCILFDIFSGQYFFAPKAFKTLRKEIEAACEEITRLWDKL